MKTLREDRTLAEWNYVACAIRRRRRILRSRILFSSYRKLRFHTIKKLREDAHSAQGQMVAEATAPRRENVPRHILFYHDRNLGSLESERKDQIDGTKYNL